MTSNNSAEGEQAAITEPHVDTTDGLTDKLLQKSLDAHVLCLEVINRLSVRYRVDSFCILLCNSWELLLKARILQSSKTVDSIYYPPKPNERPRTISLSDALRKCITNDADPIRRNLEKVEEFRHEAMHLVIGELPADVMELFQSTVLNYHKKLSQWFNRSLRDIVPEGMMWLMIEPTQIRKDLHVLLDSLGPNEINYLTQLQAELRTEARELGYTPQYMAVINVSVGVSNKPKGGDIQLTGGSDGQKTHVVYKTRYSSETHPLYQKDVVAAVNQTLPELEHFTTYSLQAICHLMNVTHHHEWHFRDNMEGSRSQYSIDFVQHLIAKIREDVGFVKRAETAFSAWKRSQGHYTRKSKR